MGAVSAPSRPRLTALGGAETCRLSLPGPIHEVEAEGRRGVWAETETRIKP